MTNGNHPSPASAVTHDRLADTAPRTHARRRPLRAVSRFLADSLLVLPVGCAAAIAWANLEPESYFRFAQAIAFPVNEIGLVFFLGLVTKEIVESTLPGGALHPWRRAALPCGAAIGGAVVPIALYLLVLKYLGEYMLEDAWVVTAAVDIAVCNLVGRSIFGRHPAMPFLLLLAIASNTIGLIALAVLNPIGPGHLALGLGLIALGIGLAFAFRTQRVRSFWPYVLGAGALSWCGLFLGGLHPALALVPVIPFLPHAKRDVGLFVESPAPAHDALTEFERWWRVPVQGVLLLFGLANSGVPLHGHEAGLWALPVAALVGRPIGVLLGTGLAVAAGLHRPNRVGWRELLVIGCISSVGLVMALFFATAALPTGPLLLQTRLGALVGVAGAALAFAAARSLRVGRFGR